MAPSSSSSSFTDPNAFVDPEDSPLVANVKREVTEVGEYQYGDNQVILYNLSIGATAKELHWTYENHEDFGPIPSFGVIPPFLTSTNIPLDWLPNFNPAKLLHGEQYLKIHVPTIPTSGHLVNTAKFLEVLDKGKAATVTVIVESRDKTTNQLILENVSTSFIRGSGGFGGKKAPKDRGAQTAANPPPSRAPDIIIEEKTSVDQAALYRLNADLNPLHIQPEFAAMGGFDKPILHGLCSMGIAAKHVVKSFGNFQEIKVRFTGVVFPGETLVTSMWKEGFKIIFETKVKERNAVVLAAAAATLYKEPNAKL